VVRTPFCCEGLCGVGGQRMLTGSGSGGTTVRAVPGTDASVSRGTGVAFGADWGPRDRRRAPSASSDGQTTTRVPCLVRSYRSLTSSFACRLQPDETNLPMVEGWLVPWIAVHGVAEIHGAGAHRVARAAGHEARQIGLALDHLGGGCQSGHSALRVIFWVPAQVKPSRPTRSRP